MACDAVPPSIKRGMLAFCTACRHPRTGSRVRMKCHESASAMRPFGRKSLSVVVGSTVYSFNKRFQSWVLYLVGRWLEGKRGSQVCMEIARADGVAHAWKDSPRGYASHVFDSFLLFNMFHNLFHPLKGLILIKRGGDKQNKTKHKKA